MGPALRVSPLLPPTPSSAGHPPAPFTGPTSRPLLPYCCYSSPHRTHHGVKDRLWTRRPRVAGAVLVLHSPPCSREALNNARETVFRLCRKSCLRGTGSPSPLLNASDLTPRRGENTQDVFYCHFRAGARLEAGGGADLESAWGRRRRSTGRWAGGAWLRRLRGS